MSAVPTAVAPPRELGLTGPDILPAGGWLRRAAIAEHALVAILVVAVVVLLIAPR